MAGRVKSKECKAIEALMASETESQLVLTYATKEQRISRMSCVYNIITRNGFACRTRYDDNKIIVYKIQKE